MLYLFSQSEVEHKITYHLLNIFTFNNIAQKRGRTKYLLINHISLWGQRIKESVYCIRPGWTGHCTRVLSHVGESCFADYKISVFQQRITDIISSSRVPAISIAPSKLVFRCVILKKKIMKHTNFAQHYNIKRDF